MRIAWFTHRYHPCVGGRRELRPGDGAAVRRGGARRGRPYQRCARPLVLHRPHAGAGSTQPRIARSTERPVHRFPVRHLPLQRYVGRLLSYAPHWPTRCRSASYMPILPGIERVRGDYDAVFAVGFPYTVFSYAALRTAARRGAADPDAVPPPGHARRSRIASTTPARTRSASWPSQTPWSW